MELRNIIEKKPKQPEITRAKQQDLIIRYLEVRERTLRITNPLQPEDFSAQPIEDVSPAKWHLAHTTWFFENFILTRFKKNYKVFHKDFNYLFNSYYESVGERLKRFKRGDLTRPTIDEIFHYRNYVDVEMAEMLDKCSTPHKDLITFLILGLNHEEQHQELLVTDIKYVLGKNPLRPVYKNNRFENRNSTCKINYITLDERISKIGYEGNDFCFDNEKGVHKQFIHAFRFADRLVTNGEYLEFIGDNGYQDHRFWLMDGWEWRKANNIISPEYWEKEGKDWYYYTLQGYKKIDLNAPVTHVSFYEAEAYARWQGKRLLTEFEWETISQVFPTDMKKSNLLERELFQPIAKTENNFQLMGDCWEWTNSAYLPYPFYKKEEGALGEYNGKFMINQMVLRGGSCATPADHIRNTYRNFFQPEKRWQFTGIRLAETIE